MNLYLIFLGLIGLERLGELWLSRRNAQRAFARGAVEFGQRHFRVMQLLHTAFLVGAGVESVLTDRPFSVPWALAMGVLVIAAQALRYWAIASLGDRWNVRVIVTPGDQAIRRGPYQYFRHPNYVAVVIEGFAIPLLGSAVITALLFSLANAILLVVRIRCEESALEQHTNYQTVFGAKEGPVL